MDSDWFNLPKAFYNNRGQKQLWGKFTYMWIIKRDLRPVLVGVGVTGLTDSFFFFFLSLTIYQST